MTFDDGILEVYRMENTAPPSAMPKETPVLRDRHYFGYDTLGRKYTSVAGYSNDRYCKIG